jgi:hypothetical protein
MDWYPFDLKPTIGEDWREEECVRVSTAGRAPTDHRRTGAAYNNTASICHEIVSMSHPSESDKETHTSSK